MPPDAVPNGSSSTPGNDGSPDIERGAQLLRDLSDEGGAGDTSNASGSDGELGDDASAGDNDGGDDAGEGGSGSTADDADFLTRYGEEALEAAKAAARDEAKRDLESQRQTEAQQAEEQRRRSQHREGLTDAYRKRVKNLETFAENQKLDAETAASLKNTFLGHHRDAVQVAAYELTDNLVESLREQLPEDQREGFQYDGTGELEGLVKEFTTRLTKHATGNLFTEAQVAEREALKALEVVNKVAERLKTDPGFLDSYIAPPTRTAGNPTPARRGFAQLEQGYAEGTLSTADEAEYYRQRNERQAAGRA